jgi:UDP-N-acetylglucosamine--N-acetylmuramyl-(pentapeptide) pyrophosphoryl-undecaprenol N-acetylglucosamine transferase
VDDHQTQNAAYLTNAGAALVIQQWEFTREKLHALLVSLADRSRLLHMAQAARRLAMPQAAATVASLCWEAANG